MDLFLNFELENSACGGIGVMLCNKLLEWKTKSGGHFQDGNKYLTDYDDKTKTHSFTSTWSYETSQDPASAGKSSDVALIPNIDVKFEEVRSVTWSSETCKVNVNENFKYNLQSLDNQPAFAFYSFPKINEKIGELKLMKKDALKDKEKVESKAESRSNDDKMAIEKYNFVKEALYRWEQFVTNYEKTN